MPVFLTEEFTYGSCSCCGENTTVSKGTVTTSDLPEAEYWVRWSEAHPELAMLFVINLPDSKHSVASLYSLETGSFMVIGPDNQFVDLDVVDHPLDREDVIDTPLAAKIFAYLDEIYLHDHDVSSFISTQENSIPSPSFPRHLWPILIIIAVTILYLIFR